jgi:hypothetical protein
MKQPVDETIVDKILFDEILIDKMVVDKMVLERLTACKIENNSMIICKSGIHNNGSC